VDGWADDQGVQLYFIDSGQPIQNAYIESFNVTAPLAPPA
jgi:putative transposase